MKNPNEYDESRFQRFDTETNDCVVELWEAGASTEDIENAIQNGLENAIPGARVTCSILVKEG